MPGRRGAAGDVQRFVLHLTPNQTPPIPTTKSEPIQQGENPCFRVALPYPPTVNRIWRRVGSKTLLSAEGRLYHDRVEGLVGVACLDQEIPPPPHCVELIATVPDRRKRDVDNLPKGLLDPMYRALGLDDSVIIRLEIEKREPDALGPRVDVTIRQALAATGREG